MGKNDPPVPPVPPENCESLAFETVLNSVDEAVLPQLREGIVLSVRRQIEAARQMAFCFLNEQRVGTISGPQLSQLIQCLLGGKSYQATITALDDGIVRVSVRRNHG